MYYRLDSDPSLAAGYMQEDGNKHAKLLRGEKIDEKKLTLPWPFTAVVDEEEGFEISAYYPGKNLFSRQMIDTIRACGVDNLQAFPARIKNGATGAIIDDYVVVNVIGVVAAADLAASKSQPLAGGKFFDELVVDEKKAGGLLMFRLAESRIEIIVAEPVAKALQAGKFVDLVVEPLKKKA